MMTFKYLVVFTIKDPKGPAKGDIVVCDNVIAASPLKVLESLHATYGNMLKSVTGINAST